MTDTLASGGMDDEAADTTAVDTTAAPAPGADAPASEAAEPASVAATDTPALPDNWRALIAGEDKALLKTLERVKDPAGLGQKLAELQKLAGQKGALPKKPGPEAKPEEVAAYRAAMGLPEKAEGYLESLALPDGRVLGEEDKAVAASFAESVLGEDYSQGQFNRAIGWYVDHVEKAKAEQDDKDESLKAESVAALKGEWGAAYKRNFRAIDALFQDAPADLRDRLAGARDGEGRKLGNDPDFLRWASKLGLEVNPAASVMPHSADSGKHIQNEIDSLKAMMANGDSEYWTGPKAEANQARYRELVAAQEKHSKRAA